MRMTLVVCNACGEPWQGYGSPAMCPKCGVASFAIAVERGAVIQLGNRDENRTQQDNIVPASTGEGSIKMTMEEEVRDALARHQNDEVMLDAFFQWAIGQFRRIGEGKHAWAQEKAYGYFLSNLHLRYGLSATNAEGIGMKLGEERKALAENSDEFELKKALIVALSGTIGDTLRKNVQRKLGEASVSARGLLAVYNWLRGFPDNQYSMSSTAWMGPLEALYRAALGALPGSEVKLFSTARDELISCGIINKSFYESSSGKTSYEEYLPGISVPQISLTSVVPPLDDSYVRTYLQALFTQQALEQARILEEVTLCGVTTYDVYGKGELPGEVIPHRGLFAYVDTERGKVTAVNPLSREILLENMLEWKMLRLKEPASAIETALHRFRDQAWPEADLTRLSDRPDRRVWRLDQIGAPRLFIFIGNWLSESDLAALRNLGAEPSRDAFLFALIDQSLPSVEKVMGNSLKMWQKASVTVMTFKDAKWTIHTLKGTPHSDIQRIAEQLSESESSKPPQDVIVATLPPSSQPSKQGPQPIPPAPPKPAQIRPALGSNTILLGTKDTTKQWGVIGRCKDKIVKLDLNAPHIITIFGKMGSGKGYTIGVICEMLCSPSIPNISEVGKKATVLVLYKPKEDVPSEFWSVTSPNDVSEETNGLATYGTSPTQAVPPENLRIFLDPLVYKKASSKFIKEYGTRNVYPLYLDPSSLRGDEWALVLSAGGSGEPLYVKRLFKIIESLQFETLDMATLRQSVWSDSDLTQAQKKLANQRMDILATYLEPQSSGPDFTQLLAIGGVNIFDLRGTIRTPDDDFSVMTLILSLLQSKKGLEGEPFAFVINEAHTYFRKGISQEFVEAVENLIRRKRHGANWLFLDSHDPGDLDERVIELSDIKVLHFTDKTALKSTTLTKAFESSPKSFYELSTGEALISADYSSEGSFVPLLVSIRPRLTKHGARTKMAFE